MTRLQPNWFALLLIALLFPRAFRANRDEGSSPGRARSL